MRISVFCANEVGKAIDILSSIKFTNKLHFYDYFHWGYLLEQCSLLNELAQILKSCCGSIKEEQDINILA